MTQLALSIPVNGLPNSTEDPKVAADLAAIQTVINGQLDYTNLVGSDGIHRFSYRLCTSNATAVSGDWIVAGPGVTITLPAPTKNLVVAISTRVSVTGASPVTVAGTNIFGPGMSSVSSFPLGAPVVSAILQADDAGNWRIISGEQDTGWATLSSLGALAANSGTVVHSSTVAQIRKIGNVVRLEGGIGVIGSGYSDGSTIATIPAAYRAPGNWKAVNGSFEPGAGPLVSMNLAVVGTVGTGFSAPGLVVILSNTNPVAGDTIWLDTSWTVD